MDLGTEFLAEFRRQAEIDGTEVIPSPVEAPNQRGLTERAGGLFKNMLYRAMKDFACSNEPEWRELVDTTCMMRNRLMMRSGYSPIQRVIGYSPRLPAGIHSDGEQDYMAADLIHIGDRDARGAMEMRKAAAIAFHQTDCQRVFREATMSGPRRFVNHEPGQAVYFWRKGAGTSKKTRQSYWRGPERVLMTSLPGALWLSFQNTVVKAAPERVRPATEEENMTITGWMSGLSKLREDFEKMPQRNFVDITKDDDEIDYPDAEGVLHDPEEQVPEPPPGLPPIRRVRRKTGDYPHPEPDEVSEGAPVPDHGTERDGKVEDGENIPEGIPWVPEPEIQQAPTDMAENADHKRELEGGEQPPEKRTRVQMLELYYTQIQALTKQRQRKEARPQDFTGTDAFRLQRAIAKEINNNLATGAYEILSPQESERVRRENSDKIMESRYVLTKKDIENSEVAKAQAEDLLLADQTHGPQTAKCRHVMKGFSEAAAVEVECTTPQVSRDSVIFIAQVLASMKWILGFLDFTQAFHSGDQIDRELYCTQPKEGIPGTHPRQLLRLKKTCYGLTDAPLAWYKHLARRLQEDFQYRPSMADPCVFLKHGNAEDGGIVLKGIIGIATDDLLHGGDADHWEAIGKIAAEYKLGKNQKFFGRFTGKDVKLQEDGSITLNQAFYVAEKVPKISIAKGRKQQRYSRCTASEIEQLRSQLGALSWLAKETRCDLAGRVSLLQQSFPAPRVSDLIEGNRIAEEAAKFKTLGIKVMPIPWDQLRVSVVRDAAWGNARDSAWVEDHPDDRWEELEDRWIRHHRQPRRTSFHPGAAPGGPDLHGLLPDRQTELQIFDQENGIKKDHIKDHWHDVKGIRVLSEAPWTGTSTFLKAPKGSGVSASKVNSSLVQLQCLSSQGGQIVIYHHADLAETGQPAMTTIAAWKSFRLKRRVVDTLAAEGQALQSGIGAVHWHRLLFLEAFYGMMSANDWRRESQKLPFLAAVDSKSLFDAASKLSSPTSYVSDKRTAIDLAVIKADIMETSGKIRWIDTRAMISDPLTKIHHGGYLRYVMGSGYWSIVEEGVALQRKLLERQHAEVVLFSTWVFGKRECDRCLSGIAPFPNTPSTCEGAARRPPSTMAQGPKGAGALLC